MLNDSLHDSAIRFSYIYLSFKIKFVGDAQQCFPLNQLTLTSAQLINQCNQNDVDLNSEMFNCYCYHCKGVSM